MQGPAIDPSLDVDLDHVAVIGEDIRERCDTILERASELLALRQDFVEVFVEVGKLLDNTEETKSALIERTALLAKEEEEHGRLKALYRTVRDESEKHANENILLRSQIERFDELISSREERILDLEGLLAAEKADTASLRAALDQEAGAHAEAKEKLAQAIADVLRAEETISKLDSELAEAGDRAAFAASQSSVVQQSLNESQAVVKQLREDSAAARQEYDKLEHKRAGLEQQIAEAKVEIAVLQSKLSASELDTAAVKLSHDVSLSVWQEKEQAASEEMDRLNAAARTERARAEASEAQLAAVRVELQTASAVLRTKENEIEQLAAKIDPLEQQADAAQRQLSSVIARLVETERSNAALVDRSQALIRAIGDLRAKLEVSEQRADQFETRFKAEAARAAAECEEHELQIHTLTTSLEHERTARILAVNSLEASRKTKGARRSKLEVVKAT